MLAKVKKNLGKLGLSGFLFFLIKGLIWSGLLLWAWLGLDA
jgi:hypothetical protein